MSNENLPERCTSWFHEFVGTFLTGSREDRANIRLKDEHSRRVRENARQIAGGSGLSGTDLVRAELIGLLHDVGRFPQYRDYRTFRDSESVNHAALGARVLLGSGVLQDLPSEERDLVVRAVALHNVFVLPDGLPERLLLHARIVRDADKLDIWRIFAEILALPPGDRPTAAGLGLPDTADYTPEILARLHDRSMVRLSDLRTLNDFKVLQLAWFYDLNLPASFRIARERRIIDGLAAALPDTAEVRHAVDAVRSHVDERMRGAGA